MMKIFRILAGLVIIGSLLAAASWAVRDCKVAPYVYENCLWLRMRDVLGLPQSKLLRALLLETTGLSILAGIYLAVRYVFPWRAKVPSHAPENESR